MAFCNLSLSIFHWSFHRFMFTFTLCCAENGDIFSQKPLTSLLYIECSIVPLQHAILHNTKNKCIWAEYYAGLDRAYTSIRNSLYEHTFGVFYITPIYFSLHNEWFCCLIFAFIQRIQRIQGSTLCMAYHLIFCEIKCWFYILNELVFIWTIRNSNDSFCVWHRGTCYCKRLILCHGKTNGNEWKRSNKNKAHNNNKTCEHYSFVKIF